MNCANHPELTASAFCQYCGKPLCASCMRTIHNIVSCEPCLAARLGGAHGPIPGVGAQNFQYPLHGSVPHAIMHGTPNPILAGLLGCIPGVGAMYNGQFAKGLVHVLGFIILVDMSHWNGLLGIGVAGWVFYQIFDAYHTALARRDGLPLPNPLGLNDIGKWFSGHPGGPPSPFQSGPFAAPFAGPAAGNPLGAVPMPPVNPYAAPGYPPIPPPIPPVNPVYPIDPWDWSGSSSHSSIPARAVVLIVLGLLFLLGNFGILRGDWVRHLWPIALIGLGVWLLIQRSRQLPPPPPPGNPTGGSQ